MREEEVLGIGWASRGSLGIQGQLKGSSIHTKWKQNFAGVGEWECGGCVGGR